MTLHKLAGYLKADAQEAVCWTALYKRGRSWCAINTWGFDLDGNNLRPVFHPETFKELQEILRIDPDAVLVNAYYCNLGPLSGMTVDSLELGLRWQYENHCNLLEAALDFSEYMTKETAE